MRNLDQLKKLIQGSAILGALLADGSIQVVYKAPPKVDEDLLFRTWTVEILIVDSDFADQARKALEQLGFETSATRDRITGSKDTPITSSEREEIRGAEKQAAKQEKETKRVLKEQATDSSIEELQQQIDELKQDVDLMGLVRPKGQAGPRGPAGAPGRDGRDVVATNARLGDLQDVTSDEPRQGQIVMWQEASQSWELRYPPKSPQAVPAGGGGGGAGIALTVQSRNREDLTAPPTSVLQNVSAISFDTDSGFVVEDLGDGTQEAFIKLNSTFNPWYVDGEETLDATGEEPVEFVAGAGITIRTDATTEPKQIIIEADGTGGGGGGGGDICVPTEVTGRPTNYADIVLDLDSGLLVAVVPEDLLIREEYNEPAYDPSKAGGPCGGNSNVPTTVSEYPQRWARLVVDLDTGELVAVNPEDNLRPE